MSDRAEFYGAAELVVEERFAIVPEWLLDADVGDCAVRLYAVLLRYGNSSGARMPGRATLARRLHKRSTDTVDRAMRELVGLGAVVVEHRYDGRQRLTNRYQLRTTRPAELSAEPSRAGGRTVAATADEPKTPGRTDAATRTRQGRGARTVAARGGRMDAAGVAARMRHDRESLTESTPPPPAPHPATIRAGTAPSLEAPVVPGVTVAESRNALVEDCEVDEWDRFVQLIRDRRQTVGGRLGCWTGAHLLAALHLAIRNRGWPPAQAARALLAVTSDPETRSPARLAEAGPWWDDPSAPAEETSAAAVAAELASMEADLASAGGLRVRLQAEARDTLARDGVPLTRATVVQRAHRLWLEHRGRCLDETTVRVAALS